MRTTTKPLTSCWKCGAEYGKYDPKCPRCEATNANVDPQKAMKESEGLEKVS